MLARVLSSMLTLQVEASLVYELLSNRLLRAPTPEYIHKGIVSITLTIIIQSLFSDLLLQLLQFFLKSGNHGVSGLGKRGYLLNIKRTYHALHCVSANKV